MCPPFESLKHIIAGPLSVAYADLGHASGPPVFLLHGFPYDIHAYEAVAPLLVAQGCRVIVPYLRGFGPTRFLSPDTPRSGEQAALGADLLSLMDALAVPRAVLAGYDWGGRAACVVAALWPERCVGLVSVNGYNIQAIDRAMQPEAPDKEHRLWYQYYFHSRRGEQGLLQDRRAMCELLWRLWSPTWRFTPAQFERSAAAFDNLDFVHVVIHSYRHRFGLVAGDPTLRSVETQLALLPLIEVPAITLDGTDDDLRPPVEASRHASRFSGPRQHRWVQGAGHNLPQEAPQAFYEAVIELVSATPRRGLTRMP